MKGSRLATNYPYWVASLQKTNTYVDKLRIKIWETLTGAIIYDNQLGVPDSGDLTTVIGGGSIQIQK